MQHRQRRHHGRGRRRPRTSCVKSGSGDVRIETSRGPSLVETGSGDIQVDHAQAELRVKSGSGDVELDHGGGAVAVSTGSGDVEIGTSDAAAVVKTGSGDLRVGEAHDDVEHGHRQRRLRRSTSRTAAGSPPRARPATCAVGVPAGTPVWTDLTTVSGSIRSSLEGAGQPADGQDHVELRAKTVTGDIVLNEA